LFYWVYCLRYPHTLAACDTISRTPPLPAGVASYYAQKRKHASMKSNHCAIVSVLCTAVLSVCGLATCLAGEPLPAAFNGKDFSGWKVPADNIWWKVEQGVLEVTSGPELQGSQLWTEDEYQNFIMEFDFKMGHGVVDSGIFIRTPDEQIQIGISGSLKRDLTASPYITGKGYPVEAKGVADLLDLEDWNSMTIIAKGNQYAVWLNGQFVMSYTSESAIERGPIGIQLHPKNDMSISYRNIRIAELD